MVQSVCPYCAVGCGQRVFVKDEKVIQIEGDPDSPVSRGRLCPKGSASEQLVNSPARQTAMLYRRPYGTEWEPLDLETATDMIADRMVDTRARTWQDHDEQGRQLRRTMGIAGLGGATLDNEENYLIKKLFTAHRRDPDREPGPYLTQCHRPQFGGLVRTWRRHGLPAGPAER